MLTESGEASEALLTRDEVAGRLRVSVRTVDRYIQEDKLAVKRLPGDRLIRIPESELAAFLERAS